MPDPTPTLARWGSADIVQALVFVVLPIAIPAGAWWLGWTVVAVVTGALSALWFLAFVGLWYAMSYEGRHHAKRARREERGRARKEAAEAMRPDGPA